MSESTSGRELKHCGRIVAPKPNRAAAIWRHQVRLRKSVSKINHHASYPRPKMGDQLLAQIRDVLEGPIVRCPSWSTSQMANRCRISRARRRRKLSPPGCSLLPVYVYQCLSCSTDRRCSLRVSCRSYNSPSILPAGRLTFSVPVLLMQDPIDRCLPDRLHPTKCLLHPLGRTAWGGLCVFCRHPTLACFQRGPGTLAQVVIRRSETSGDRGGWEEGELRGRIPGVRRDGSLRIAQASNSRDAVALCSRLSSFMIHACLHVVRSRDLLLCSPDSRNLVMRNG